MAVSETDLQALVGHRFPGGTYRIAHWENALLTEATGSRPLPGDLAHPVHLFHVPIAGAGVTIAELFALAHADSDASVTIDYYDWEVSKPLRESTTYLMRGGITEHSRKCIEAGPVVDSVTFRIEVMDESADEVARVTFRWNFWRFAS